MINKIIAFSINNKFIIGLLTLALIGTGIWSMMTVNLGSVPDITNNQVQVITQSPNLATEDIEQFVTYPVELSMGNLPGVTEIRSISRFGLSVVTIVFKDDMGTYLPRQLVQEKLNELGETIPDKFGSPAMGPISTGLGQIYEYTIKPKEGYETEYSPMELRTIQDWIIKRQLTLLEGVVEVNSFGGSIKQYEVAINPEKLNSMGISISEVYEALARNNVNTGGAYIEKNKMSNFIRGEGLIRSLEDIRKIAITTENSIPITIGDVAEDVQFGNQVRYGAFTQDGEEAVGGIIMMLKGANPNAVIQDVKDRMAEVEKSLPEGLTIEPIIDRSELIARTTDTVKTNLLEGALIVIFALVLLLGSLRGGLITATTIPLSLLFAFILMKQFNVWANLMSLGAIDFGIIIDGAVIIIEGTVYEIQKRIRSGKVKFNQAKMDEVAYDAGSTMMSSAFFGQIIILIVFTPILFLTGVEGKMFKPMAYTFGFAMIGAIFLCLTYVPMMSALFMKPIQNKKNWFGRFERWLERISDKIIGGIQRVYMPLLKGALKLKLIVVGAAAVLLVLAGFLFSRMGGEFVPQLDEGDIAMQALIRPGSSLTESIEVSKKIENILLENFPEIKTATARIGVADIPTDPMPMDIADMYLILEKDKDNWTTAETKEGLIAQIKEKLNKELTGVNLVFTQPVELRFNELLEGVREDIAVKLYGEDLGVLSEKVQEMANIIQTVPGAGDVNPERTSGLPQMTVKFNRDKIAQYGLDIQKANDYISTAFAGGTAGVIFEGEKRFDLVVRFDEEHRKNIDDLRGMYIDLPDGTQVPIKEIADIEYVPGPMQISRDDTYRRTYVGVNARGRDVESVVNDIQQRLDEELELPPGYYITYGGEFENLQSAKDRLIIVVPIALFLIFVLLYFALKSFSQSVMIYIAIPLAAIGGVFALWLRGMPFSISAGVGFIVLFGVAVLNGLVLINRFNSLKEEGVTSIKDRIFTGTKERIRPIMLTATTDIFGFLPMAFSTSAGAEVQQPLATVVIGGMLTATLLTLVVLPVLYTLVERKREKKEQNKLGSSNSRSLATILIIGLVLGGTFSVNAQSDAMSSEYSQQDSLQTISLEDAKEMAIKNFPQLQAAQLEIESEEVLRKTAFDFGNTQIFTGKEEVGNGSDGIYTQIGVQQQGIDIFGIVPRLKLQKERVALAENALELSTIEIEREVSRAWTSVYTSKKRYQVYKKMDSIFEDIERAARIRYETEATSKLEYLATSNQGNEVKIQLEQAYRDYLKSIQRLNLWFVSDTIYDVPDLPAEALDEPLNFLVESLENHPLLQVSEQRIDVAKAVTRERKSEFLPKFQGQYGRQEIAGQSGFFQYQIGIQIPLFFGPELGRTQEAQVNRKIAEQNFYQDKLELEIAYKNMREDYIKWRNSWNYYRDEALPLAQEQQDGSVLAFKEGAIDYVTFLQNIRDAIRIEVNAWSAFNDYLDSRYQLEYYLKNSN
ncbi:CusA/CzcA family heavy metal efflux RND transporter [Gramella sp. BOM4]|jgi:cobalt-zinc-cadmium resistance protein CzcA|uniref:AcrB/AcrD/AcrF family heavy metal cation efflux protein n=6 Tax=Bacteroidota TaxID=976 RepID=A0A1Y1SZJ2_9FLAO|nr:MULTISPECIES: CusA/CzcA family heavy metal efflux RND transporter [Flavobacteriaceae]MUP47534.1 CusA/CzcA family heavy metal efflux RND transporter [Christiangramia bathymodioli]APS38508.1 multidrug transporter AcrB [Salegentibacter sp. T436]ORL44170.1 AcrB/AcrD/AcrF family heavy metal cation efflux protein [Zunongwangia atlantica 22II14-10F7]UAB85862.1 CusA/CzcA family heavy metal efflux RND transporter [Zunongwangia sp. SCSIO 43204]SFF80580.1 cobalt-zinc-cadmium resistance protein CzcA [S